jgi:hypothetical protein
MRAAASARGVVPVLIHRGQACPPARPRHAAQGARPERRQLTRPMSLDLRRSTRLSAARTRGRRCETSSPRVPGRTVSARWRASSHVAKLSGDSACLSLLRLAPCARDAAERAVRPGWACAHRVEAVPAAGDARPRPLARGWAWWRPARRRRGPPASRRKRGGLSRDEPSRAGCRRRRRYGDCVLSDGSRRAPLLGDVFDCARCSARSLAGSRARSTSSRRASRWPPSSAAPRAAFEARRSDSVALVGREQELGGRARPLAQAAAARARRCSCRREAGHRQGRGPSGA